MNGRGMRVREFIELIHQYKAERKNKDQTDVIDCEMFLDDSPNFYIAFLEDEKKLVLSHKIIKSGKKEVEK